MVDIAYTGRNRVRIALAEVIDGRCSLHRLKHS
jgi:hypothetical protein